MKKHLQYTLAVVAIALSPFCASAQATHPHGPDHLGRRDLWEKAVAANGARHGNSTVDRTTAATGSRLKSLANLTYTGGYTPDDSTVYNYSGTRGGVNGIYGWQWQYDSSVTYTYSSAVYSKDSREVQQFDANNNSIQQLEQQWSASTTSWLNSYQQQSTYDASNNLVLAKDESWNMGTNTWDSTDKFTATYDGSHNLLSETDQTWDAGTMSWVNAFRYSYTYDGANNMLTSLEEAWNTGSAAWENGFRTTFTYDAGNNRITELGETWTSGAWVNQYKDLNSNFTAHQPGTSIFLYWNSTAFDTVSQDNYTFNSYDQPLYYFQQDWDQPTSSWTLTSNDKASRYHYELYTTAVKNISNDMATISVYPVPAKSDLTIDIDWKVPQAFTITLMDMQGRMYTSYRVDAHSHYSDKISVDMLPAGNYVIKVASGSSELVKKVSIEK